MKYMFIDDNGEWLGTIERCFRGKDVVMAECHSLQEAIEAIETYKPDVIFLDHQLTEDGNEGFKIAEVVAGKVKIYSTTDSNSAAREYEKRGIEHIKKYDLLKFKSITS